MTALSLPSCTSVTIKDKIFYGSKGMQGAVQFHSEVPGQVNLTLEQWMTLLRTKPLICSSVDTFAEAKGEFEKLCSMCNCCSTDTTKAIETFFSRVESATKASK